MSDLAEKDRIKELEEKVEELTEELGRVKDRASREGRIENWISIDKKQCTIKIAN